MKRIGITGGIACGKSEVVRHLRKLGASVSDADELSRSATAQDGAAIGDVLRAFGLSYFDEDGRLNRRKLGEMVFRNASARARLESIIHPVVVRQMEEELASFQAEGAPVAFLDVPLLYETGMEAMCDEVWVVVAPHNVQMERLTARDGLSRREALDRIRAQMSIGEKSKRADRVLRNDGSLSALCHRVEALYKEALAQEKRTI